MNELEYMPAEEFEELYEVEHRDTAHQDPHQRPVLGTVSVHQQYAAPQLPPHGVIFRG